MSRFFVLLVVLALVAGGASALSKRPDDLRAQPGPELAKGGVSLVAIYGKPTDEQAFLDYYTSTHAPLAAAIPGLQSYRHGKVWGGSDDPPAGWYAAILTFKDRAALEAGLASPEGQKTAADLANFATGGVHLMFAETGENTYR
ncbi:MAG TPA: EthD family reductase [Gemmatimonadota bacterium]